MPHDPLRLFVAIYPPLETRRAMVRAIKDLDPPPDPRHRVTPVEQVHMTAHFIGDTDPRQLDEVIESVRRSTSGLSPFSLRPTRLRTLPERGRPRLIALETDAPPRLMEVHRRLVHRLARPGRGRDHFLPHVTLCRFNPSANPTAGEWPVSIPGWEVGEIVLVRSVLRREGADHATVETVRLEV
ncbi:MAG: RNA 2',3'-cyclic phosphodiesterase [Phycisphaerae bacterium]|nr:RNA 2',3'-cyclic phosphodiesterase [Phycisphaerae bacterium]